MTYINKSVARAILTLAAAVAGAVAPPATAEACTWVWDAQAAAPFDGQTDVPLDVVPWFRAQAATSEGGVRLLGPGDNPVAIDVQPLPSLGHWQPVEVHPHAPLAPDTQYTLLVEPPEGYGADAEALEIRFTTGSHHAADDDVAPLTATLELLEADESFAACLGGNAACVGIPHSLSVEVRHQWDDHLSGPTLASGTFVSHYTQPSTESPFCLELRNRNLAGATSEPTVVCTEDAVRYRASTESLSYLDYTCGTHGFSALPDDAVLVEPAGDGGCSVSGAGARRAGSPWAPALLLAALGLAAARRRAPRSSVGRW